MVHVLKFTTVWTGGMETLVRFLRFYLVHTTTIQTLSKPFAETFLPFFSCLSAGAPENNPTHKILYDTAHILPQALTTLHS